MFAYCRNNPVNNSDNTGYFSEKVIFPVCYGHEEINQNETTWGWKEEKSDPHPVDVFIFEFVGSQNPCAYLLSYEWIGNLAGSAKIASGLKRIDYGMGLILAPIPTLADETAGLHSILWGFHSVIKGLSTLGD